MTSVKQMAGIVHPPPATKRVMIMLKAYLDESGAHYGKGGSKFFTISGYIAPEAEWNKFDAAWKAMLDKYRVPYFHATDIEGKGSGKFRRLTQSARDGLKTDAVNISTKSGLIGL